MAQIDNLGSINSEMSFGTAASILAGTDRPVVRIVVEGRIGSGKTALLAMIKELLENKVELYIENEYTRNELDLEHGTDRVATLTMYSPVVLLCERLIPNI